MAYVLNQPSQSQPTREQDSAEDVNAQFAALNFAPSGPPPSHFNHQPLPVHSYTAP